MSYTLIKIREKTVNWETACSKYGEQELKAICAYICTYNSKARIVGWTAYFRKMAMYM